MDAIRQFRNLMAEVDRLFRVCAIGGFSRGVDRLEVFDNLIEKISNFDVTTIEDELTADASKLKDNLQTARLVLRNAPKSLNKDKFFHEYSELGAMYEKIKKIDGEEWASRVVGGLAGVTSHANGLIADVSKIIDELAKYDDEGEKPDVKQNEPNEQQVTNGRPKTPCFRSLMYGTEYEKDEYLRILKKLMQGVKGKDAATIMLACKGLKIISHPPFKAVVGEFGEIGCRQGYNNYLKTGIPQEEIENIKQKIKEMYENEVAKNSKK